MSTKKTKLTYILITITVLITLFLLASCQPTTQNGSTTQPPTNGSTYTPTLPTGDIDEEPPDYTGNPLVGTWNWFDRGDDTYRYTFDSDGTGIRGTHEHQETFRWTMPTPGQLEIRVDGSGLGIERWDYMISEPTLTIFCPIFDDLVYVYTRYGTPTEIILDEELFGVWFWDTDPNWTYYFSYDGTGTRGTIDDYDSFTWNILNNRTLRIISDHNEDYNVDWYYIVLYGELITMEIENETHEAGEEYGLMFRYTREIELTHDSELVGTWTSPNDYGYEFLFSYTFNEDGTGTRTYMNETRNIAWGITFNGYLRIKIEPDNEYETIFETFRSYSIVENTLNLVMLDEEESLVNVFIKEESTELSYEDVGIESNY